MDYSQCFDTLPLERLLAAAELAGFPASLASALRRFYRYVRTCFRIGDVLSNPLMGSRRVIQGDALSVALAVFWSGLWGHFVLRQQGILEASVYVDDKAAPVDSPEAFRNGLDLAYRCCNPWGMRLNMAKCVLVVNTQAANWDIGHIAPGLSTQYAAKLLGVMIGLLGHDTAQTRNEATLQKMITSMDTLCKLSLSLSLHGTVVMLLLLALFLGSTFPLSLLPPVLATMH